MEKLTSIIWSVQGYSMRQINSTDIVS